MNKKSILIYIISTSLFSIFFWYYIAFWAIVFWSENENINKLLYFKTSNNIYTDSNYLNKINFILNSKNDIKNYKFISKCAIKSKLTENYNDLYLFEVKFLKNKCLDKKISFVNTKNKSVYSSSINVLSEYDIYSKLLDYDTGKLLILKNNLEEKLKKYLIYEKIPKKIDSKYFWFIKKNRKLNELKYNYEIVNNILKWRESKYTIPVIWEKIPYNYSKIPNAGRPYRAWYTDWIHHGWDIWHKFWENVVSVDNWIIIRVISDFKFSDLDKIKHKENLTYEEKLTNLDILRWNQVWLKTMKWDIVIYSHLNEVNPHISNWQFVTTWELFWTIWITWIPDKNYKDYHLHMEIYKNPYNILEAWKYSLMDYMKWDWYFKWESANSVLEKQSEIFKNDYEKIWYIDN